jgi:hypothetical protein
VFFGISLPDVVGGRKTCVAATYDDDIRGMTASQRLIDNLVLKINCFEPIVVCKILIEVRGFESLTTVPWR